MITFGQTNCLFYTISAGSLDLYEKKKKKKKKKEEEDEEEEMVFIYYKMKCVCQIRLNFYSWFVFYVRGGIKT